MRAVLIIVGIVLLALGTWVAMGKLRYNDTETRAQFGPVKVEATTQKIVPAPIGYAGIVLGGVLILTGTLRKK